MSGFSDPIIGGGGALVYPQIQSPNFSHGVSGWRIGKDGTAEFNSLTLRGTFDGTDFVINASGAFFYSGTPAAGNLVASIAPASGTDQYGNTYFGGITAYDPAGNVVELAAGSLFTFNESTGVFTNLVKGVLLVYKGGGGLGNLIASIAPASGTDQYGNAYPQGMNVTQGQISGTTFSGTDFTINSAGAFFYSGTPAAGNLILSIASAAGTDQFNNAYLAGETSYGFSGVNLACQSNASQITFWTAPSAAGPWSAQGSMTGDNLGNLILGAGTGQNVFIASPFTLFVPMLAFGAADARLNTDAAGYPTVTDGPGLTQQISGSKLASANTANVTTTALTSLGFMTVPASDVETGASYQVHASGSFSTGNSVPTSATFKVFWGGTGGTVIATLAIPGTLAANLSGAGWFADAEINWLSTSEAAVTLRVGWHTGSGVAGSVVYFAIADTTGLTTGSSQNLSLGFQWGSAPGGQQLLCDICRLGRVA